MSEYSCQIRNLHTEALSGFFAERDAVSAGGHYLRPGSDGWLDAAGLTGLFVTCENCGSVVEEASDLGVLYCPDCGESIFRVIQTYRLVTIKSGFAARWHVKGLTIAIDIPNAFREGMTCIRYTIDGSDPTQESLVYDGPIPYRKEYSPIRAAVFYQDARTQVIEWDYGRAETNRKRIQKQSNQFGLPGSSKVRIKEPVEPKEDPKPTPPKEGSDKKNDEDGKGCGCLVALAMGVGGMCLIGNDWKVVGWILVIVATLVIIGMSQDKKK